MQHNIKKIKEILVPYTAEENAELSGGEDTVPPPLPRAGRRRARRAPRRRTRRRCRSARPRRKRKDERP